MTGFEKFEEKDIIKLAVANEKNIAFLNKWLEESGLSKDQKDDLMDNSVLFGKIPYADINYRLRIKLKSEHKQLPNTFPNLIVIRDYNFFNFYRNRIRQELNVISKYLSYDNVAIFILIDGYGFDGFDKVVREGKHLYSLKYKKEHANEVLIVSNTSSTAHKHTRETRRKIVKGFTCGIPILL